MATAEGLEPPTFAFEAIGPSGYPRENASECQENIGFVPRSFASSIGQPLAGDGTPEFVVIPLSRGLSCKVDAEFAHLADHRWHAVVSGKGTHFYAACRINGRRVYLHREIMQTPPGFVTDHINHDTLDNRVANLRVCSQGDNMRNRKPKRRLGAYFDRGVGKWAARLQWEGKRCRLGLFETAEEAADRVRSVRRFLAAGGTLHGTKTLSASPAQQIGAGR
jgi:hypothetical protein